MRRYTSLLLTAFIVVLIVVTGSAYLAGHADEKLDRAGAQEFTVYTTLPAEQAAVLVNEYEKWHQVHINLVPLSEDDILRKMRDTAGKTPEADMVIADRSTMQKAAAEGRFVSYISEPSDAVTEGFKDINGYWTGIWYDPIVFAVNKDYLASVYRVPTTWTELARVHDLRISMTDFMASGAAANLYFSMMAQYGDQATYQLLSGMHPKVVQYAKYLSTPVRMAGMGESDLAIAVQSEALRYIHDGYPLSIVYPADGTSFILICTGILQNAKHEAAAKDFADWLLGDEAQLVQQKNGFFFVSTNPATLAYKSFAGKDIVLFTEPPQFTERQRHGLLDHWMKKIRFR
jgi:iron(III) transport system substrate-binding protein